MSTAQVRVWPDGGSLSEGLRVRIDKASHVLAAVAPQAWDIWTISYRYTSLPQVAILLRSSGNKKLLVYNHGHGGIPNSTDTFALEFLRVVHAKGYDIILTSMPLTGLNEAIASESYTAVTRSNSSLITIAPALLKDSFAQHALYELIGDPDHYLHYFIDGGLMPAFALSAGYPESGSDLTPYFSAQNLPNISKKYESADYVGFSGGLQPA